MRAEGGTDSQRCVNNGLYASDVSVGAVRRWTAHVNGTVSSW